MRDTILSGVAVRVAIADFKLPVGAAMQSEAWLNNARGGSHGQEKVIHDVPVNTIEALGAIQEKTHDVVPLMVTLLPHGSKLIRNVARAAKSASAFHGFLHPAFTPSNDFMVIVSDSCPGGVVH